MSKLQEELTALRRHFHMYPEPGFQEFNTQKRIQEEAAKAGVPTEDVRVCATTGLVIDIKGQGPSVSTQGDTIDVIALRADMDCLPMMEANPELPYESKIKGMGHMCGHDGHMASMVGVMKLLAANAKYIPQNKTIRLLFQPSEEAPPGGAPSMIKDGCLEGVEEVYGYHCWPLTPVGTLAVVSGPIMAASCELNITIKGKGGHGSMPHVTIDPIVCAAEVIVSLQTIIARKCSCKDSAVITVAMCNGGEVPNVIPDSIKLRGTIRATDMKVYAFVKEQITKIATHVALAHDCIAEVNLVDGYPVTVNHDKETGHVQRIGTEVLGEGNVEGGIAFPLLGSEDFSYYILERPGCFWFMGGWEEGRSNAINHNTRFDFNDNCIPHTVHVYMRLAEDRLGVPLCPDLDKVLPMQRRMVKED